MVTRDDDSIVFHYPFELQISRYLAIGGLSIALLLFLNGHKFFSFICLIFTLPFSIQNKILICRFDKDQEYALTITKGNAFFKVKCHKYKKDMIKGVRIINRDDSDVGSHSAIYLDLLKEETPILLGTTESEKEASELVCELKAYI